MIVKFFLEIENVVGVACPIWFMMLLLIIPPTSTYSPTETLVEPDFGRKFMFVT
jgi:hypothetical protein